MTDTTSTWLLIRVHRPVAKSPADFTVRTTAAARSPDGLAASARTFFFVFLSRGLDGPPPLNYLWNGHKVAIPSTRTISVDDLRAQSATLLDLPCLVCATKPEPQQGPSLGPRTAHADGRQPRLGPAGFAGPAPRRRPSFL